MNDFDDRISRHMESRARTIDVFGGDLDAVVHRARQRRQRRRAVSTAALMVVVGAGAALVVNQREQNETPVQVEPGPETGSAESSLQWTKVETASGLGWSDSLAVGADGTLYALSTSPGVQKPDEPYQPSPQLMYSSTNGVEWAAGDAPADLWASSLDSVGGRLYAVGTGPASAAAGEPFNVQVAASDDGGSTWSNSSLPFDIAGLKDRLGNEVSIGGAEVAVSPSGAVLATVTVSAWVEPSTLLPADVEQRWGLVTTAAGVDVYGPPADLDAEAAKVCPADWTLQLDAPPGMSESTNTGGEVPPATTAAGAGFDTVTPPIAANPGDLWCVSPDRSEANPVWAGAAAGAVAQSFTWDELGVEPELQSLIGGQVRAFLATDGVTFEEVSIEMPGDGNLGVVDAVSTPYGFAVVSGRDEYAKGPNGPHPPGTVTVLTSPDGRTWSPHPAGELTGWVRSAGLMGDSLAVVLDGDSGTQLAVSPASGPWSVSSPLDALEQRDPDAYVNNVVAGPLGAAALIGISTDPITELGGVSIEGEGGYVLRVTNGSGAAQLLDASGAVVAETTALYDPLSSPNFSIETHGADLVIRDPATGDTLATFAAEDIDRATQPAFEQTSPQTFYVAHSVDGATWSVTPLADLLGEAPTNAVVSMTPTNVVVRASYATPEVDVPQRQVALVGTPAG